MFLQFAFAIYRNTRISACDWESAVAPNCYEDTQTWNMLWITLNLSTTILPLALKRNQRTCDKTETLEPFCCDQKPLNPLLIWETDSSIWWVQAPVFNTVYMFSPILDFVEATSFISRPWGAFIIGTKLNSPIHCPTVEKNITMFASPCSNQSIDCNPLQYPLFSQSLAWATCDPSHEVMPSESTRLVRNCDSKEVALLRMS